MKSKITKSIVLFFVIVVVIFSLKKEYSIQDKSANGEILASNLGIIGDKLSRKTDDFTESSWEIVSEEETESITKRYEDSVKIIVEENRQMIVEFLKEFPKEAPYKWFEIFCFDFNRDETAEIILSKSYAEASGIISYNYVYNLAGDKQFEFLSLGMPEIYNDEEKNVFYIHNKIYITGRNIIGVYWEVSGLEIPEAKLMFMEWDTRTGKEQADKAEEGYYVFTELTNEEIVVMSNGLYEMTELLEGKKEENIGNVLEAYREQMLNCPQEELEKWGSIYCNGEKIFVEDENGKTYSVYEPELVEQQEDGNSGISIEEQEESEGINSCNNPYFPYQGEESLYADGEYYDEDMDLVESGVKLKISFIKAYENGSVYKLSMESLNYYQDYRTHIYLYVTEEQIYRIYAWTMGNEEVISFYNDDEQLKEILDTDEKIIDHADIVCQEEEINEDLEQGEEGRYYTVKKTGDQIVGGYLWIKPNGEIGYYEGFTWKEDVGLINYYSGYGAERDIINLNNIGYEIKPLG